MRKLRIIASVGLISVLFMVEAAQAQVTDGLGFYVRPSREIELGSNPPEWVFFTPFRIPPPAPVQSDIVMTSQDPLTVLVPLFEHMPETGYFGTWWSREGDTITINGYFFMGGVTEAIYGRHEYICPIGQLPAGTYHVDVNFFRWGSQDWDTGMAADFIKSPGSFAAAHGVPVFDLDVPSESMNFGAAGRILHQSQEFTVVPEPASLGLLFVGAAAVLRRRFASGR